MDRKNDSPKAFSIAEKYKAVRREVVRKVRQVGVLGLIRHVALNVGPLLFRTTGAADPFDSKYGTDTARIVGVGALDIPEERLEHSARYEPVEGTAFLRILGDLPIAPEQCVFVDIGSGKGRALLLASMLPFREIVGVEHSRALTETARQNIRIFKDARQRCPHIRVVCGDAATFGLPPVNSILYLFNPFGAKPMRSLLATVEASWRAHPRDLVIVYVAPVHRAIWDQSDIFNVVRSADGCVIYRSQPTRIAASVHQSTDLAGDAWRHGECGALCTAR